MTSPIDPREVLELLRAAGRSLAVVATGGGSRAISDLCEIPGASRVVVEGLVPYAREPIDVLLGGRQEQYCSDRTARRLAVAAWQRAAAAAGPGAAVGAAVTASLATLEPKRGPHRVHAAVQTSAATHTAAVELVKGARSRCEEEEIAAGLVLATLAAAFGRPAEDAFGRLGLKHDEPVERETFEPPTAWRSLFTGEERVVRCGGRDPGSADAVIFPGSFDPLHDGHRLMARLAEEIAEAPVVFELSITNVDKPMLDFQEIRDRTARFDPSATVWLTRAATFLEKAELFPNATFVMGADTFRRLGDPRYYGGSREAAAAAVDRIAAAVAGLIVFGRVSGGSFEDASRIEAPEALRRKAYFVSQREFRMDVSSTEIRRKSIECGEP